MKPMPAATNIHHSGPDMKSSPVVGEVVIRYASSLVIKEWPVAAIPGVFSARQSFDGLDRCLQCRIETCLTDLNLAVGFISVGRFE